MELFIDVSYTHNMKQICGQKGVAYLPMYSKINMNDLCTTMQGFFGLNLSTPTPSPANSSLASYFLLKCLAFETSLPLEFPKFPFLGVGMDIF